LFLSRSWANWQRSLIIVQPATVLRWRRRGLWAIWLSDSCRRWRGGRPRISSEVRALIVRMSQENFLWGAPRIHGELLKLGFDVSQATVSRYMPRRVIRPPKGGAPSNQAFAIGAIGFGEAGRLSDVVRGWIMRVGRRATKVRGWHPLHAYRAIVDFAPVVVVSLFPSCRSALRPRALRARLLRGPPLKAASIGLGQSTTFTVSAQGHHRDASCKHSRIAHDHPLSRAEPSGPQFVYGDCTARLPQTNLKHCQSLLQKVKIFEPVATWRTRRDSDIADKVMRNDRRRVKIPVGASPKVMLERTPGVATVILTTTNETAWTEGGFRQAGARRARRLAYRTGSLSRTCAAPP
jgi:hypothetical protein